MRRRGKLGRNLLGFMFALAMVVGLLPGMGRMAYAAVDDHTHTIGEGDGAQAVTFEAWGNSNSLPADVGSFYLTKDVTLSATWSVPSGGVVNLCLNGKSIKRAEGLEDTDKFSLITVPQGATLNLYDEENTGVITGGFATNGGAIYVNRGTLNINGGSISDNQASSDGGGVYVSGSGSTVAITGGKICQNNGKRGGGVFVSSGAVTMSGGEMSENTASTSGGGAYVASGSFDMSGGEIIGNKASGTGGGIDYKGTKSLALSGNITIKDNLGDVTAEDSSTSNVYLETGKTITITDALTNTTPIGISMPAPAIFTNSTGETKAKDYQDNFTSDAPEYLIDAQDDELKLFRQPVSYLDENGDSHVCREYTPVDIKTSSWNAAHNDGWYVVEDSLTFSSRITVTDTVNLILCDDVALTAKRGITVKSGNTLNIYSQGTGENMGKLIAGANATAGYAGIGSSYSSSSACGTINIYGGNITATGGTGAAGIGGGSRSATNEAGCAGGTVSIYGGAVTAIAGKADATRGTGVGIGAGGSVEGTVADHGTITLGTGMYLYGGDDESTTTHIKRDNDDFTRNSCMVVNSIYPLGEDKDAAKAELDTLLAGKNEADYDAEDWAALNAAITDGKAAIDEATTVNGVAEAKDTAVEAANAVKTKAQKAAEALAAAKETAKAGLDALLAGKNEADYDADDWAALNAAIADGKAAIDAASTIDGVDTAEAAAEAAADAVKSKADKVADMIGQLPSVQTVTTTDKEAIEAVRAAFDALTGGQQNSVPGAVFQKLVACESIVAALEEAQTAKAAQATAEAAQAAAEAARATAEADKATAEAARATAEASQAAAEAAQATAEAAQRAAEEAQATAEAAQRAAEADKATAEAAQKAAEDAQAAAEEAQRVAEEAQAKAEADKKAAEDAQAIAEASQKDAEEKAAVAEAARKTAEDEASAAKTAQKAAEQEATEAKKNTFEPLAKAKLGKVKGTKGKISVKWKSVKGAKGYEIVVSKNRKGTKQASTFTAKGAKKVGKTIKKLQKGKYYVKVRAYKTYKGNTVYGKYSKVKAVKVK